MDKQDLGKLLQFRALGLKINLRFQMKVYEEFCLDAFNSSFKKWRNSESSGCIGPP